MPNIVAPAEAVCSGAGVPGTLVCGIWVPKMLGSEGVNVAQPASAKAESAIAAAEPIRTLDLLLLALEEIVNHMMISFLGWFRLLALALVPSP
jgi:hypothetical protein